MKLILRATRYACAAIAFLCAPSSMDAQASMVLKAADARVSEEFTGISSVRELSDGRVIVSEEKDTRIVIADFKANVTTQLGKIGDGPGEYRRPGQLYAFGGDTTVMPLLYESRWLLYVKDRYVETLTGDRAIVQGTIGWIRGTDATGHLVTFGHPRPKPGEFESDSMFVLRYGRATGRIDTVAMAATMTGNSRGNRNGPMMESGTVGAPPPTPPRYTTYVMSIHTTDQLAMFSDGWIAVAHVRPYTVTWCPPGPAPRCTTSPTLAPSPPMTMKEKVAYLEWTDKTTKVPPTKNVAQTVGWPDFVPAFVAPMQRIDARSVFPAPDGRLVIERFPTADAPAMRYDIIDRQGTLSARLTLPVNYRIVGFGAKALYVAATDNDGIERLQRHPWP